MAAPVEKVELSEELKAALGDASRMPKELLLDGVGRISMVEPIGFGFKSVVWKIADKFGRNRAVKLALKDDYGEDRRDLKEEVVWSDQLAPSGLFARLDAAGEVCVEVTGLGRHQLVFFVEEMVPGRTLQNVVLESPTLISISFLRLYMSKMLDVLSVLDAQSLQHDDLHPGNVMISPPVDGMEDRGHTIKIVDMGSLKSARQRTAKTRDDHLHCLEHFILIYNVLIRRADLTRSDRRFLKDLRGVFGQMADDDPHGGLRDPRVIRSEIAAIEMRSLEDSDRRNAVRLTNPFEFISAEHIANDQLLVKLFAHSVPWFDKVSTLDPCLLTGPRGCGKSTIFRWLSIKAHLQGGTDEKIDDLPFSGFYVSCSLDLHNRVSSIDDQKKADGVRREIVHYFNMLLAREVCRTLELMARRKDGEKRFGINREFGENLLRFISSNLGLSNVFRLHGASHISRSRELVEESIFETNRCFVVGKNLSYPTTKAFLGDFSEFLCRELPYFLKKRIVFLVDDFSRHRVPDCVQRILAPIIWDRRATHLFKVSAEKNGVVFDDGKEAPVDLRREFVEVDCGNEFIELSDKSQEARAIEFATELLNNRLLAAGWKATAEAVIGESQWEEHGSLVRCLVEQGGRPQASCYHGMKCIAQVCSGDVSALLMVFGEIFQEGGVKDNTSGLVPAHRQHKAIKSISRRMFERIKLNHPYGPEMQAIADAFGRLVRDLSISGRPVAQSKTRVEPQQRPRIEIDGGDTDVISSLPDELKEICNALIRRSVFIEMAPGIGRHGNVTTLRWHLRRIFLPHFNAPLAKNASVSKNVEWFKRFLIDPNTAAREAYESYSSVSSVSPLFDGLDSNAEAN